jgi:flagellar basal-body rod modification protein FlgD
VTTIDTSADPYTALGLSKPEAQGPDQGNASKLGLDTFFKLMVTQLKNQDPSNPADNGQFLAQIAQFGTVSGLDQLNKQFTDLSTSLTAGQALQAGSVVGREVLAPLETGRLENGGSIRGQAQLDHSAHDLVVSVTDSAGQLVKELHLGAQEAGPVSYTWDGSTDSGGYATPGMYTLRIQAQNGDTAEDLQTQLFAKVESVSLGANGSELTLNLQGLGTIDFNQITQIH